VLSRETTCGGHFPRDDSTENSAGSMRTAIVAWQHRVVGEPVGDFVYHKGYNEKAKNRDTIFMMGAELPYYNKIDHWRSEHLFEPERTRVAAWRGIGAGYTKFAIESMIDEIAHLNKTDPRVPPVADRRCARQSARESGEMSGWGKQRPGARRSARFRRSTASSR
jgi:isoquinoline 1-oxidoreductase beta subunit